MPAPTGKQLFATLVTLTVGALLALTIRFDPEIEKRAHCQQPFVGSLQEILKSPINTLYIIKTDTIKESADYPAFREHHIDGLLLPTNITMHDEIVPPNTTITVEKDVFIRHPSIFEQYFSNTTTDAFFVIRIDPQHTYLINAGYLSLKIDLECLK